MIKSYRAVLARFSLGLVLLAASSVCWAAPAPEASQQPQAPARSDADRPLHTIPFDLYDNRIYLQVSGPGFGPRPFLLDTGAQSTHYTAELVAQADLRTSGSLGITGTGTGRIRGRWVAPTSLRIGSLVLPVGRGVSAPAEALFGPVFSGSGRRFDGVLGYELFAAFVVEIDYAARQLRLYERGRGPRRGVPVAVRIIDRKPYAAGTLRVSGADIPALLHIDTGFGGTLSLNGRFVAEHRLLDRVGSTLPTWLRGVGGRTEARLARIEGFRLGQVWVERPIATLALVQGAGVRAEAAGRVGGELLRRSTVTIALRRPHGAACSATGARWDFRCGYERAGAPRGSAWNRGDRRHVRNAGRGAGTSGRSAYLD